MIRLLFTEGPIPRESFRACGDRVVREARRDLRALDSLCLFKSKEEQRAIRRRLVSIIEAQGRRA